MSLISGTEWELHTNYLMIKTLKSIHEKINATEPLGY